MTDAHATARRLLEQAGEHPVLTVYFDLDPSEFAIAPARASQLRSLIDEARAEIEQTDVAHSHDERMALRRDLERVERFLQSGEAPVYGARALAIFSSSVADLFAPVALHEPTPPRVVVSRTPYLEPMLRAAERGNWCVVLVNRSSARILAGVPAELTDRDEIEDDVHGRHRQGGWSWPRYERGIEEEVDAHLRRVARELQIRLEREAYDTLVLDGPTETVSRLRDLLPGDVSRTVAEEHLSLDVQQATEEDVRLALEPLLRTRHAAAEQAALARVRMARGGAEGRAVAGREATDQMLTERRVERLLLAPDDGSLSEERELAIELALRQDADVLVFDARPPEVELPDGIGALVRY